MTGAFQILRQRRFAPLFATQFLNAFNDNFYKMAMVILVTFSIYRDPAAEASFNALAAGLFILPYVLFSALAGQLADSRDKAAIIRIVKTAEIVIMMVGALSIWIENVPLMLATLFAMGTQSTFFGPIKYAILPQHLESDEVLVGTGWVEAGTYVAILLGTIVGGLMPTGFAMVGIVVTALIGRLVAQQVPPAPPESDGAAIRIDWNIVRSSWRCVAAIVHICRLLLAVINISFFWAIGAILLAQFPPLVKNALGGDNTVATLFTAIFSVGVAIGSVVVIRLLKGEVSARYSAASVLVMGLFVVDLWWAVTGWGHKGATLMDWQAFLSFGGGRHMIIDLLGIAIAGGMYVVPLYAFLTTTVAMSHTARTVAANNIVNCGFMVGASLALGAMIAAGVTIADTLLLVAVACVLSALLAMALVRVCRL